MDSATREELCIHLENEERAQRRHAERSLAKASAEDATAGVATAHTLEASIRTIIADTLKNLLERINAGL